MNTYRAKSADGRRESPLCDVGAKRKVWDINIGEIYWLVGAYKRCNVISLAPQIHAKILNSVINSGPRLSMLIIWTIIGGNL